MEMDEIPEQSLPQSSKKHEITQEFYADNDKTINAKIISENAEGEVLHVKVRTNHQGWKWKQAFTETICFLHYREAPLFLLFGSGSTQKHS